MAPAVKLKKSGRLGTWVENARGWTDGGTGSCVQQQTDSREAADSRESKDKA